MSAADGPRLAFVVQRYCADVNGGAEQAARALAEQRTASAVDALVRVGRSDGPGAPQARSALNQMRGGEIEPDALYRLRDLLREESPSATTVMRRRVRTCSSVTNTPSVLATRMCLRLSA